MKNLKPAAISFAVLVLTGSAFGQDFKDAPFPDTPKNHWAYEAVDAAFKLVQPEFSYFHHRGSEFNSRIKFTQALVHVYSQLAEVEANSLDRARQVQVDLSKTDWQKLELKSILNCHQERVDAEDEVERCQEATLQLKRVFNEFLPELKYLQIQQDGSKYRLFETNYRVRILELSPASFISADQLDKLQSESERDLFCNISKSDKNRYLYQLNSKCAGSFGFESLPKSFNTLSFSEIEVSALIISYFNSLMNSTKRFEDKYELLTKQLLLEIEKNQNKDEIARLRDERVTERTKFSIYENHFKSGYASLKKLIELKAKSLSSVFGVDTNSLIKDVNDCIPRTTCRGFFRGILEKNDTV